MKKQLLLLSIAILFAATTQGQRYVDSLFTSTVTSNVIYGNNIDIRTGAPVAMDLKMDVYEPAGDLCLSRPLVIILHAGTYLPILYNDACVGTKTDSSIAEMCRQFAYRGYVAVSMDYRLGWNPLSTNQDTVTGSLFQAAYRTVQDAKACVRFMKANASTYKIDTTRIIMGGDGAGAITALHYVALNDTLQLWIPDLLNQSSGQPYVNIHALGDFDGYGGIPQLNNPNNSPGHTSNIQMVFSIYGLLGDTSFVNPWPNSPSPILPPIVAFHPLTPPFGKGPFCIGPIYALFVPALPNVSGPCRFICRMDSVGLNNVFITAAFSDVYTQHANTLNSGCEAIYPFETGINPNTSTTEQEDMWTWYDLNSLRAVAPLIGLPAAAADSAYAHSIYLNPNMSKTQAMAYIDTMMHYVCPRIVVATGIVDGVDCFVGINEPENFDENLSLFPNPVTDKFHIEMKNYSVMTKVELFDISGRLVYSSGEIKTNSFVMNRKNLDAGIYLVKVFTQNGSAVKKITLQ